MRARVCLCLRVRVRARGHDLGTAKLARGEGAALRCVALMAIHFLSPLFFLFFFLLRLCCHDFGSESFFFFFASRTVACNAMRCVDGEK